MAETERKFGTALPGWTPPRAPDATVLDGAYARLERLRPEVHSADLHAANCADDRIWDYLGYGPFAAADEIGRASCRERV